MLHTAIVAILLFWIITGLLGSFIVKHRNSVIPVLQSILGRIFTKNTSNQTQTVISDNPEPDDESNIPAIPAGASAIKPKTTRKLFGKAVMNVDQDQVTPLVETPSSNEDLPTSSLASSRAHACQKDYVKERLKSLDTFRGYDQNCLV